jgi:tyrosyl-tRNA synthetase
MNNIYDELRWRGVWHTATEGLSELLANRKITLYAGFDPTAPSLHVGSLIPIVTLMRFQLLGHSPIAIAGGGTGLIGDPSGKSRERQLLSHEQLEKNLQGIKEQLSHFLDFKVSGNPARLVNNADWLTTLILTNFLREVGKHFTINNLIAKESVKRRLENEEGLTFTEFSYGLLQAYDYLMLHDTYGCTLQIGGSDQWGNIINGIELIRRVRGSQAHGLVLPLVTTASGVKFGKTENGTIWLDPNLTSPFRFYQFWLNTDDRDVIAYLKYFTLLSRQEIEGLELAHTQKPEKREAQYSLAQQMTRLVHGELALRKAEQASAALFGAELQNLTVSELLDIFVDVPSSRMPYVLFSGNGLSIVDLLVSTALAVSKNEARRLIEGGGIYLNNLRITDYKLTVTREQFIEGILLVLRKGTKEYHLVRLED